LFPYQLGNRQNPLNNNNMIGPRSFERYRRADIRTVNLAFVVQQTGNAANPAISQVVISSSLTRSSSSFQANMSLQAVREVTLMGDKDLTLDEFPESFRKQVDNAKRQKGPLFSPDQVGYKPIIPPQP
jgi:hypothetical protein